MSGQVLFTLLHSRITKHGVALYDVPAATHQGQTLPASHQCSAAQQRHWVYTTGLRAMWSSIHPLETSLRAQTEKITRITRMRSWLCHRGYFSSRSKLQTDTNPEAWLGLDFKEISGFGARARLQSKSQAMCQSLLLQFMISLNHLQLKIQFREDLCQRFKQTLDALRKRSFFMSFLILFATFSYLSCSHWISIYERRMPILPF